jgi:peptide/nickel transport system ATP-binding protein
VNIAVVPPLLEVKDLRLTIPVAGGTLHALRGVDLVVRRGETLGLVGESGSGKSLSALSVAGLQPRLAARSVARLALDGDDLSTMDERALAKSVRGARVAMIFQEPMTSLNPVMTIGQQLTEGLTAHGRASLAQAEARAVALLERVGIAGAADRLSQYPHQFSGGQRQRVMIAMALMSEPELLIADEPTTALDVTVQMEILRMLADLQRERGLGLILVTHNLGVVSRVADRIAVMYAGEVVEDGPTQEVLSQPRHPYTQGLIRAIPESSRCAERLGAIPGVVPSLLGEPRGCAFAPRCPLAESRCLAAPPPLWRDGGRQHRCVRPAPLFTAAPAVEARKHEPATRLAPSPLIEARSLARRYKVRRGLFGGARMLNAVDGVDLDVAEGEVLAIVGESGCGKSTLGAMLAGLKTPGEGAISVAGRSLASMDRLARARLIQPIFQDPMASLNPRQTVLGAVARAFEIHGLGDKAARDAKARSLLTEVGLPERLFAGYPGQLSGGQRQRVAIARALALEPSILICDEPTSALDVSVQAQILNLLQDMRARRELTIVLITHDLSVVAHMATRVAVMYLGRIVETGPTARLMARPRHPYTRALIASSLSVSPGAGLPPPHAKPGFANPLDVPAGCAFHPRCPFAVDCCREETPALRAMGDGSAACHLATEEPPAWS